MSDNRALFSSLREQDIPTLPQIIAKVVEKAAEERSSAADLTKLLEQDHAISLRILRLANSPFYGLAQTVDSIRRAIVVLGFEAVCSLALATSVIDAFSKKKQSALDPEDFWMHAFGSAKAAQVLATRYARTESPETCFTVALLSGTGKFLLALVLKEKYEAVVEEARQNDRLLCEVERERLGTTHAEAGAWLMSRWHFPHLFAEATQHLYSAPEYVGLYKREVAIVALAASVSRLADFGLAGERPGMQMALDPALLDILRLSRNVTSNLIAEVSHFRTEAQELLDTIQGSA